MTTNAAGPGTLYRFVVPDGTRVPDPGSRFQPQDVHGPSEVIDPASYSWSDAEWQGRPWPEAILYELHIGTFTPEGTFSAAIEKLDHLAALGVTGIEIMPVANFAGKRNWGYDGVLLYAPDSSYGRPEDLKRLVEAAHARGLMVILDVVYNHFGPDGNYLPLYAPQIFTSHHKSPWGDAVNYDDEGSGPVRQFAIHNTHLSATREHHGYYGDYMEDTEKLAKALTEGFASQGELMKCTGCERGEPSAHLPPSAFIALMQNHDQIGNRAFGDRMTGIALPEAVHAITTIHLLLPQTPMLFMGEEWGTNGPWSIRWSLQKEGQR